MHVAREVAVLNGAIAISAADVAAVDERFALIIGRGEVLGPLYLAVAGQYEGPAEVAVAHRHCLIRLPFGIPDPIGARECHRFGVTVEANPLCLPIVGLEEAHRPMGRRAPGRLPAGLVPNADFPKARFTRRERLDRIKKLDRLIGLDTTAVPPVAFVPGKLRGRAGDEDLIGALRSAA